MLHLTLESLFCVSRPIISRFFDRLFVARCAHEEEVDEDEGDDTDESDEEYQASKDSDDDDDDF